MVTGWASYVYSPGPEMTLTQLVSFLYPWPLHKLRDTAPVRQHVNRMSKLYSPVPVSCTSESTMILWTPFHCHHPLDKQWVMVADRWNASRIDIVSTHTHKVEGSRPPEPFLLAAAVCHISRVMDQFCESWLMWKWGNEFL